jgi:hypothetical protein
MSENKRDKWKPGDEPKTITEWNWWLRGRPDLRGAKYAVVTCLIGHWPNVFPGHRLIAEEATLDISTVERALRELADPEWGVVTIIPGAGGAKFKNSNGYELHHDAPIKERAKRQPNKAKADKPAVDEDGWCTCEHAQAAKEYEAEYEAIDAEFAEYEAKRALELA